MPSIGQGDGIGVELIERGHPTQLWQVRFL